MPVVPPIVPPACAAGDKPVQVFILMGQSNMLGEGKKTGTTVGSLQYAVETEKKYVLQETLPTVASAEDTDGLLFVLSSTEDEANARPPATTRCGR